MFSTGTQVASLKPVNAVSCNAKIDQTTIDRTNPRVKPHVVLRIVMPGAHGWKGPRMNRPVKTARMKGMRYASPINRRVKLPALGINRTRKLPKFNWDIPERKIIAEIDPALRPTICGE